MNKKGRRKAPPGVVGSVQLRDPVHGSMQLDGRLGGVLRHPLVQRLAWVWQTSLVCMVFPGATHNRLSHVLGVAHCAKTILERLHQEGWRDDPKGKTAPYLEADPGQAVPFHTLSEDLSSGFVFSHRRPALFMILVAGRCRTRSMASRRFRRRLPD